jgi:hypothetical protein
MTKKKEYLILLGDGARKRHYHETRRGKVVSFAVQLEILHKEKWLAVLRYDSSHGFSHVDRYNLNREQKKEILGLSFQEALTDADFDINENWSKYKDRFLRGDFP